jgi:hypothetical protein
MRFDLKLSTFPRQGPVLQFRLGRGAGLTAMLALLVLLGVTGPLHAQSGGQGYFGIGVQTVEIEELNERLLGLGYPEFDRTMLSIGGGGYAVRGRTLMIGGEGYGLYSGETTVGGRDVRLTGGYGLFQVGYLYDTGAGLELFPTAGFGAGGLALSLGPSGTGDDFDDVVTDPNREATLHQGSLLLSVGFGGHYRFGAGSGGPTLGLHAGYTFQPYTSNWRLGGNSLADGPDVGIEGLFVRVTIGGGR